MPPALSAKSCRFSHWLNQPDTVQRYGSRIDLRHIDSLHEQLTRRPMLSSRPSRSTPEPTLNRASANCWPSATNYWQHCVPCVPLRRNPDMFRAGALLYYAPTDRTVVAGYFLRILIQDIRLWPLITAARPLAFPTRLK